MDSCKLLGPTQLNSIMGSTLEMLRGQCEDENKMLPIQQ
jgi:hypothetical protein